MNQTTPSSKHQRHRIPETVSPLAAERLGMIYGMLASLPPRAKPTSVAEWDAGHQFMEELIGPKGRHFASVLGIQTSTDTIGGVPVLRFRPARPREQQGLLVYAHGGAYVVGSAASCLSIPSLISTATGLEVVSIDYTRAPHADWKEITDQVVSVWTGLIDAGHSASSMAMFGDSAGGALVAGSVLKMRDQGIALPAALWLLSPWSDITATGDTIETLVDFDPTLTTDMLGWAGEAYAAPEDQRHPYVSPVYGDYEKEYPDTLIQAGTREIFLSYCVRHYQAIRSGNKTAVLDLYEGMPHAFQALAPDAPETQTAIARAAEFLLQRLK